MITRYTLGTGARHARQSMTAVAMCAVVGTLAATSASAQTRAQQAPVTAMNETTVAAAAAPAAASASKALEPERLTPAWEFTLAPTFRYASTKVSQADRRHGFGVTGGAERRLNRHVGVQGTLMTAWNRQLNNLVWPSLQETTTSLSLVFHPRAASATFRPYMLAGMGYDWVRLTHPRCDCGSSLNFGTSHAGLGFRAGSSDFVSLLAEGNIQTGRGTAFSVLSGISFAFGGRRGPAPVIAVAPPPPPPPAPAPAPVVQRVVDTVTVVTHVSVAPAPAPPPAPKPLLVLPGALFEVNKATLFPEAKRALDQLIAQLNGEYASEKIQIIGYTDNTGSAEYNNKLGLRRADAVRAYLASRGVSEARLSALSGGENNPVASNDTPEGRQLNRRVVIQKM